MSQGETCWRICFKFLFWLDYLINWVLLARKKCLIFLLILLVFISLFPKDLVAFRLRWFSCMESNGCGTVCMWELVECFWNRIKSCCLTGIFLFWVMFFFFFFTILTIFLNINYWILMAQVRKQIQWLFIKKNN
jgi:hypothetical protein